MDSPEEPLGVRVVTDHQQNFLNRQISLASNLPLPDLAPTQYAIVIPGWPHVELIFQSGDPHVEVNGITMEVLLAVCVDRLRHYQEGKFRSRENAIAMTHIEEALLWMHKRTRDREVRGVEGKQVP
jgi:hypothetical protein